MATLQELENALVNADKAGDTEAAQTLAQAILQARQVGSQGKGASGSFAPQGGASGQWQPDKPSGFRRGFLDDPITGLKQLGAETEIAALLAPDWARKTKQSIQSDEQAYQAARGENGMDWPRLGGQMINPVNLGLAALTKTPPGASLPMRMGMSGVGGAMMGGVAPVYGDATREGQAAAGGVGGVVAAPIAGGVARVVKPKVDPNVALLRKEGITPSLGQHFGDSVAKIEDKAASIPILGDILNMSRGKSLDELNLAVYNRALAPVGMKHSGKLGQAGVSEVRRKLSDGYKMTLSGLKMKPDNQFTTELTSLNGEVAQMMPAEQNIWARMMARLNSRTKAGEIDQDTLKTIHTTLDEVTDGLRRDGSFEKVELADTFDALRSSLNEAVKRNNPQRQAALSKLDDAWANYSILRDAAFQAEKRKGGGLITPSDLESAVVAHAKRDASKALAKGRITEGQGRMQDLSTAALRVLPSQYPDSGTTGRALFAAGGVAGLTNPSTLPYALSALAASTPYMPGGRTLASWMASGRQGQIPGLLSDVIRRSPALAAPIAPSMIYGLD